MQRAYLRVVTEGMSVYTCGEAATNHHYSMCIVTLYNYTYNASKHRVMAQSGMYIR